MGKGWTSRGMLMCFSAMTDRGESKEGRGGGAGDEADHSGEGSASMTRKAWPFATARQGLITDTQG
jgi:hypothetical protein